MTQRLQQENQLLVLKLSLCLISERVQVVFDLSFAGKPVGRLAAAAEEIGLPMTFDEARAADREPARFKFPDHVMTSLEAMTSLYLRENDALWLQIDYPCGNLPLVPWEQLLQRLSVPVLRLPNLDIQPVTSRESLDTIICMSLPKAHNGLSNESVIERLIRQIPSDLAKYTHFHLFADKHVQPILKKLVKPFKDHYQVTLYHPSAMPSHTSGYTAKPESLVNGLENPWLTWMLNALRGRSADVVHFLCHGYLDRDKGNLMLAQAPLLDASQLSIFLNRIGAWSVAFSSPLGNDSPCGLRLLQEQISRIRPGPVLLHDMERDCNDRALREYYRFLYAPKRGAVPHCAAVSLYCHPLQLSGQDVDTASQRILDEFTLAQPLSEVLRGPQNTPGWIAASQRSLEQVASGFSRELSSERDKAIRSGTESALRFTSKLLAKAALQHKEKP